jgi:hypothetical protein
MSLKMFCFDINEALVCSGVCLIQISRVDPYIFSFMLLKNVCEIVLCR